MNVKKHSEVKKVNQKDAKKSLEDKDGVTEGDYDADDPEDKNATSADGIPDDERRKKGFPRVQEERNPGSYLPGLPGREVRRGFERCKEVPPTSQGLRGPCQGAYCYRCRYQAEVSLTVQQVSQGGRVRQIEEDLPKKLGRAQRALQEVVPTTTTEKTLSAVWRGLLRRRKVNASNRTKEAKSQSVHLEIKLIKQLDDRRYEALSLSLSLSLSQLAPPLLSYLACLTFFHLQALPYLVNDSLNKLQIL